MQRDIYNSSESEQDKEDKIESAIRELETIDYQGINDDAFDYSNDENVSKLIPQITQLSNEIPAARLLLEHCNVDGAMILTDALHTQTLTAREIVQDCGGDYLMTVKANQKGLLENLHNIHSAHKTGAFPPSDGRIATC